MTPVPIPCSRNAHDQNVLARRPQRDQHGCHPWESETGELGGSMRGQTDGLLCSCNARSRKTLVGHAQWETI